MAKDVSLATYPCTMIHEPEIMSLYTDTIRRWATDTRRTGFIHNADGTGEVGLESSQAGRRLAVRFTLKMELDRISDARYEVFGCGFSMAACAVAADMAVGYSLGDVQKIDAVVLDKALDGLPSERSYCADLAVEALQAAVKSVRDGYAVERHLHSAEEHGARVTVDDDIYKMLMGSPRPEMVSPEDRHLFACLVCVAAQESCSLSKVLGLADSDIDALLNLCFPGVSVGDLASSNPEIVEEPPECNRDVLDIVLKHVPTNAGFNQLIVSVWLAKVLATRASLPGHLWVAMGLTERPQLTAAIRRHLPSLAEANDKNMRWKRYLYKQVCDLNGGSMCKAPNCGVCSDYHLCFVEES